MQIKALTKIDIAAWLIMATAMLYVLHYNLLPGLLAGLLVFELVHIISPYIAHKFPGYIAKVIASGFVSCLCDWFINACCAWVDYFFQL